MGNNFTDIAVTDPVTAATINDRLDELDAAIKINNYAATAAPTINDDEGDGYSVGSRWFDTTSNRIWECIDPSAGAAVWHLVAGFVGARVYNSANISIPDDVGNFTALTFDTEIYDTDSIHSPTVNTSRLTCQTAGYYHIEGHVTFAAAATGRRAAQITLNGLTFLSTADGPPDAVFGTKCNPSTDYYLNVGDYVELEAIQSSGSPLNVLGGFERTPAFMMHRIG